jgi:cation transport ATPase
MGIIRPDAIESSSRITTVVLDKTEVTTGKMMRMFMLRKNQSAALQRIASLESGSEHPIAQAIVLYVTTDRHDPLSEVTEFRSVAGRVSRCC